LQEVVVVLTKEVAVEQEELEILKFLFVETRLIQQLLEQEEQVQLHQIVILLHQEQDHHLDVILQAVEVKVVVGQAQNLQVAEDLVVEDKVYTHQDQVLHLKIILEEQVIQEVIHLPKAILEEMVIHQAQHLL
jgi:hypothetical protein